jgi:hypothetical protein
MMKRQPGGARTGRKRRHAGGESTHAVDGLRVRYWLKGRDLVLLDDVQWADWDQQGRLLVATRAGLLQVRRVGRGLSQTLFEEDLSALRPNPSPAPAWAASW